jgi:hypothetical protein
MSQPTMKDSNELRRADGRRPRSAVRAERGCLPRLSQRSFRNGTRLFPLWPHGGLSQPSSSRLALLGVKQVGLMNWSDSLIAAAAAGSVFPGWRAGSALQVLTLGGFGRDY